mmetsp:Transcript_17216/g.37948  ORF Transcript_17216/g.37948 Transcript_17216/m.37948 type:complete len:240 (-) Transcript_17216:1807-2526(-)
MFVPMLCSTWRIPSLKLLLPSSKCCSLPFTAPNRFSSLFLAPSAALFTASSSWATLLSRPLTCCPTTWTADSHCICCPSSFRAQSRRESSTIDSIIFFKLVMEAAMPEVHSSTSPPRSCIAPRISECNRWTIRQAWTSGASCRHSSGIGSPSKQVVVNCSQLDLTCCTTPSTASRRRLSRCSCSSVVRSRLVRRLRSSVGTCSLVTTPDSSGTSPTACCKLRTASSAEVMRSVVSRACD